MKKIVFLVFAVLLCSLLFPTASANSGVELNIRVIAGPSFPCPMMKITNKGNATAHNIHITDLTIEGKVLYNNRETKITDDLDPDSFRFCGPNTWVIGYGLFTMNVTVRCDEGVFYSESVNGFIIGPLQLIP